MSRFPPFHARPIDGHSLPEARQLAIAAGAPGVYVANALAQGDGETLGVFGADAMLGLCWFGPRGNLLVLEQTAVDPQQLAAVIQRARWPWRIGLGPPEVSAALVALCAGTPLVHRPQVWYGCRPAEAAFGFVRTDVRRPGERDRDALMQATLSLNEVDLRVDPRRVDRRWLRETIDARIRDGTSRVLDAHGQIGCKLDLGSDGPAGTMIEGVFTFPEARGLGLATSLVATATALALTPLVCLHVAADNKVARAVYERAGMRLLATCQLLLLA
ncbi:MAG: GNAT family N-acetyltransferase [Planctomycetes bacterium]|nr:GNAT family N-acetyltransferase [Planctomycetota bacterium]